MNDRHDADDALCGLALAENGLESNGVEDESVVRSLRDRCFIRPRIVEHMVWVIIAIVNPVLILE